MTQETAEPGAGVGPPDELDRLRIDRSPATRRHRRRVLPWVVVVVLLLVVVGWIAGSAGSSMFAPKVTTASVLREAATADAVRTTASGYVVARRRAAISSRLSGRLERLLVDVGDRVTEGQLLGQLGHDDLAAAVAESKAMVLQRRADVATLENEQKAAKLDVDAGERLLSQASSNVEVAKEQLTEAERVLAMEERLEKGGAGSRDARDRAKSERDVQQRRLRSAEAARDAASTVVARRTQQRDVVSAKLEAARAAVQAAEAAADRAEALRADADILAPFSGVVLRKEAEVGEMVAPVNSAGSTTRGAIVTLADFASLEMEVDVIERDIGHVSEGLPCRILLDSRRNDPYLGNVRQVVPTADRTRGTVQVKVSFDALDEHVLPEMSGRVEFLDPGSEKAALAADRILVHERALALHGGKRGVFLVDTDTVSFREVQVKEGVADGDGRLEVADGLRGGEVVVLDPPAELVDGGAVRTAADASD